jgi:hypothetical protein
MKANIRHVTFCIAIILGKFLVCACTTLDEVEMESDFQNLSLQTHPIVLVTPIDMQNKKVNTTAVHPSLSSKIESKNWLDSELVELQGLWARKAKQRGYRQIDQIDLKIDDISLLPIKFKSVFPDQILNALRSKTSFRFIAFLLITGEDLYNQQDELDRDGAARIRYSLVSGRKIWTKMIIVDLNSSRIVYEARDNSEQSNYNKWSESKTIEGGLVDRLILQADTYPAFPTRLKTIENSLQHYVESMPF